MSIVLFWVVFSFLVAFLADSRGRSSLIWFLLAVVLSPVIAAVAILCMANVKAEEDAERRHKELLEAAKQSK